MFCTRWRRGGRAATFETPKTTRICVELKSWGSWWCSGVIWTISQDPVIKWNTEGSKQKQQQKKLQLKFCLGFVLTPHTQSPGYFYPLCSCWKSLRLSLLIQKLNSWIFSISLPSLLFSLRRLSTGSLSLSVSSQHWVLVSHWLVLSGGGQVSEPADAALRPPPVCGAADFSFVFIQKKMWMINVINVINVMTV